MDYMKQIAEMLGVELGEKFKIKDDDEPGCFWFDFDGLYSTTRLSSEMPFFFISLIRGNAEIIKIPWRPRQKESYYFNDIDGIIKKDFFNSYYFNDIDGIIKKDFFNNRLRNDLLMYKLGKIYRTQEEAFEHAKEDRKFWNEIIKELDE